MIGISLLNGYVTLTLLGSIKNLDNWLIIAELVPSCFDIESSKSVSADSDFAINNKKLTLNRRSDVLNVT